MFSPSPRGLFMLREFNLSLIFVYRLASCLLLIAYCFIAYCFIALLLIA